MTATKIIQNVFLLCSLFSGATQAMEVGTLPPNQAAYISTFERMSLEQKNAMLLTASFRGDIRTAGHLLWYGAQINMTHPETYNMTPLMAATLQAHRPMVYYLLHQDADTNSVANSGKTALFIATKKNNPDIVRLLLAHHAKLNSRHEDVEKNIFGSGSETTLIGKITPLMAASAYGYDTIAEVLLAHGAHVLAKDSRSWTPLLYAVRGQKIETTRLVASFLLHSHLVQSIERKTELEKANSLLESMRTSPKGMFSVTTDDVLYDRLKKSLAF